MKNICFLFVVLLSTGQARAINWDVNIDSAYAANVDTALFLLVDTTGGYKALHPSVEYYDDFLNGFFAWMVFSDYTADEEIYLNCSNDPSDINGWGPYRSGIDTAVQPVATWDAHGFSSSGHLSDPAILRFPVDSDTLWIFWRASWSGVSIDTVLIFGKYTLDGGINWSSLYTQIDTSTEILLSPAYETNQAGDSVYVFVVETGPDSNFVVKYITNHPLNGLTFVDTVDSYERSRTYGAWHIEVRKAPAPADTMMVMLSAETNSGPESGLYSDLFILQSYDAGDNWVAGAKILENSPDTTAFDRSLIYRSSLAFVNRSGVASADLYYTGANLSLGTWSIGYTILNFPQTIADTLHPDTSVYSTVFSVYGTSDKVEAVEASSDSKEIFGNITSFEIATQRYSTADATIDKANVIDSVVACFIVKRGASTFTYDRKIIIGSNDTTVTTTAITSYAAYRIKMVNPPGGGTWSEAKIDSIMTEIKFNAYNRQLYCDEQYIVIYSHNCNGLDDNASGVPTWYEDSDGDGYGTSLNTLVQCAQPTGYVDNDLDCDDSDINIGLCSSCCLNNRGNANTDPEDKVNVSDISYLVSWLFGIPSGPTPECAEEANANGDSEEKTNVSDISYLVAWLFGIPTGPEPPTCP